MIIKYINEGAFGSYKNLKLSKEDKRKTLRKISDDVYKKMFKDLDFEVKLAIFNTICSHGEGNEDILYDNLNIRMIWDECYDFVEHSDTRKLECNFITTYHCEEDKESLVIYTQIPVYLTRLVDSDVIIDNLLPGGYGTDRPLLEGLKKAEESMYIDFPELNEKLRDWFNVDNVNWIFRYHLVDEHYSNILNDKNIFKRNVVIKKASFADFEKHVLPAFDWFFLNVYNLKCDNIVYNFDGETNCNLERIGKYFKINSLLLFFPIDNNVKSLGNYKKAFISKSEWKDISKKYSGRIIMKDTGEPGIITLAPINQLGPLLMTDRLFTDELLTELFGYTNITILDQIPSIKNMKENNKLNHRCINIRFNIYDKKDISYQAVKKFKRY